MQMTISFDFYDEKKQDELVSVRKENYLSRKYRKLKHSHSQYKEKNGYNCIECKKLEY